MARSSRRRSTPARRRVRGDWVYRGVQQAADAIDDQLSTYAPSVKSMSTGESAGHILYDSKNYIRQIAGNNTSMNTTGRAAGKRPRCLRVQGIFNWEADTWASGDDIVVGFRIGVFQQDSLDGFIQVDANYTMMNIGFSIADYPDNFANQPRSNLYERRVYQHFATGNESSVRTTPVNVGIRATLGDDECLAIYMEMAQNSVGIRYRTWFRTYVVDDSTG